MPYRKTELKAGEHYHIYNRGNNFQPIFFEHENYVYFLRQFKKYFSSVDVEVVAYCLMPNHYHLLVHLKTDRFSEIMQAFSLSYSKSINKRFGRVGSLFQGRFKSVHVDRNEYLLHLSRYIHLNPVKANLVSRAEDWEFSSCQEFIGLRNGTLPKPEIVLSQFPTRESYRIFVESYIESDNKIIQHLVVD
jgi:REP element-mobilizing transposase RayT